jgi:hypothetical protein
LETGSGSTACTGGLSPRALGKMFGVDSGSLSRWETGERRPERRAQGVIERFLREGNSLAPLTVTRRPEDSDCWRAGPS